jgi:hypothetical protein
MIETTPSIRGVVQGLIPSNGGDALLFARIEGRREEDTQYDKADVTIDRDTKLTRMRGGEQVPFPLDSLAIGMKVEATFTGPVMESYPVRATASQLVVLE